ncbi:hypothetical protein U1Q18_044809 [Sarracenia purpurea var. burkii]
MTQRVTYELAHLAWESGPVVVQDKSGQRLASVPIKFLADSRVDQIVLLSAIIRMCVVEDGSLFDQAGSEITDAAQLQSRKAIWHCSGELVIHYLMPVPWTQLIHLNIDSAVFRCSFVRGPRFKFANRSPTSTDETSTMSDSKRSSTQQTHFACSRMQATKSAPPLISSLRVGPR